MDKFCKHCGKPLENGMPCDCEDSRAESAADCVRLSPEPGDEKCESDAAEASPAPVRLEEDAPQEQPEDSLPDPSASEDDVDYAADIPENGPFEDQPRPESPGPDPSSSAGAQYNQAAAEQQAYSYQRPPRRPSRLGIAFKRVPKFLTAYAHSPAAATRAAIDHADMPTACILSGAFALTVIGLLFVILYNAISLFSSSVPHFGSYTISVPIVRTLFAAILCAVILLIVTTAGVFFIALAAKSKPSLPKAFIATAANLPYPTVFLLAAFALFFFAPRLASVFFALALFVWILVMSTASRTLAGGRETGPLLLWQMLFLFAACAVSAALVSRSLVSVLQGMRINGVPLFSALGDLLSQAIGFSRFLF